MKPRTRSLKEIDTDIKLAKLAQDEQLVQTLIEEFMASTPPTNLAPTKPSGGKYANLGWTEEKETKLRHWEGEQPCQKVVNNDQDK